MTRTGKSVSAALAVAVIVGASALAGCATPPPYRAYGGPELPAPETALFKFVSPAFISEVPFKLDGEANTGADPRFMEGTFYSFTTLTTDWSFAPGRHEIEFYAVDVEPPEHFIIGFEAEPGRVYEMRGSSQAFTIAEGGVPIRFDLRPVPVLPEPAEDEPHATLSYLPGRGAFATVPYVLRIDGMVRERMFRLHPRWTTMNYSSLARGVVTSVGLAGMIVQPNVDLKEGYLSIRLAPGTHRIEYFCDALYAGRRFFGKFVRELEFTAEAGGHYLLEIVPDPAPSPSGVVENGARIVRAP